MFSFAKIFADIAKALGASAKIIGYGISVIIISGGAWYLSRVYYSKNEQLNSVSMISKKQDIIIQRLEVLETKSNILNNNVCKGFGEVNILFKRTTEYYDQRFDVLDKNQRSRFEGQKKWLNEEIDKLLNFTISEKKNETPYRLTSIP